nr:membrane-associated guanylate kinase, WW and PDZ domain-containing protein 1-like [Penaeus vannamei]
MAGQESFRSMPSLDDFSDLTGPSSERPRARQDKAPKKRDAGDREQKPQPQSKSSGASKPRKQFFGCRAAPSAPPSGPTVRRRCPSYEPDPQLALKRQRDLLSDSEDSDSGDCPRRQGTKVPKGLALPKAKGADPPKGACGASKASVEGLSKGSLPAESHGGQQDGDKKRDASARRDRKRERKARREQKLLDKSSGGSSKASQSQASAFRSMPSLERLLGLLRRPDRRALTAAPTRPISSDRRLRPREAPSLRFFSTCVQ